MNLLLRGFLPFVLIALASCGGGGGDDGPGAPAPSGFRVSVDRSAVTFDFIQGAPSPQQQVLNATWTGTPPDPVFIAATLAGPGLSQNIPVAISQAAATITLSAAPGLVGGTYTGTVNLLVCSDSACNQRVGGTPIAVNYTVNVRTPVFSGPAAAGFIYTRGTTPQQAPVVLNIAAAAGAWTASVSDPFITLSKASGTGPDTLSVFFDASDLANRPYGGVVTVTGANGSQTLPVRLEVTAPNITIGVSGGLPSLEFGSINGVPIGATLVNVNIDTPGSMPMVVSSNQPWATVSGVRGDAPGPFTLTLNPAIGPLASGTHTATLRVEVGNGNFNVVQDFPVTLHLAAPTLTVTTNAQNGIALGGPLGREFDQIPSLVSINTGVTPYAWSASGLPSWLDLDRTNGATSTGGQQLLFAPLRSQATPGTATATLTFTAQVNGDTLTTDVPVSFNLDTHRLIASENGVAFVSTSNVTWRRLSRTLTVRDNFGITTSWTATDDAPWLTTTPSGTSGGNLALTANTAGLANGLHLATVTISSTDASVAGPERIRVGLWVTAGAPPAVQVDTIDTGAFNFIAADPIRPYAYVHERIGATTTIRIFNVYTGQEVLPAIAGVASSTIAFAPSSDGSSLFVYDRDGETVRRVNLDTRAIEATFPAPRENFSQSSNQIRYGRPNGVGVLLTSGSAAYLAGSGARVGTGFATYFELTRDSSTGFLETLRRDLDFTSAGGGNGQFLNEDGGFLDLGIGGSDDIATNSDGSRVYVSAGNTFFSYNGLSLAARSSLPNMPSGANNVQFDLEGRLYTSSLGVNQGATANLWVYGANETEIHNFAIPQGIEDRGLVVSGDGFVAAVIGSISNGNLYLVPIGP